MDFHWDMLTIHNIQFNTLSNNVKLDGNTSEYDEQNERYIKAGFTDMNTQYYQTFDLPEEYHIFAKKIFTDYSLSVIKQMPGQTIPEHFDTFYQFSKNNSCTKEQVCRLNFFLEDWKSGHYFELLGEPFVKWRKMNFKVIRYGQPHLSGNMGLVPKYTMQITGLYEQFKRSETYTKSIHTRVY
jgi:hypothetical protein